MANSGVIVTDAFEREQLGQALGVNQMVAAVGSILGPVVGGLEPARAYRRGEGPAA
jgi:MFS family permease